MGRGIMNKDKFLHESTVTRSCRIIVNVTSDFVLGYQFPSHFPSPWFRIFFVSKLENKQKIQAGYFAFSTWFAVCVLGRTIPVCVRIRFLPRLPSATSTKFISIRSGFASVFLQFRAMNSNFDVLVLSIFLGNTKFMKVSSIVPIGVLACFKYLILNFTCREVAGLNNYPGGFKLLKTINQNYDWFPDFDVEL